MATYRLVAKVDSEPDDTFLVRSPAVGMADGLPRVGEYLNPSDGFLTLTILNRRYVVELPRKVQGLVTERYADDTWTPVAYGQPLFRLSQARDVMAARAGDQPGAAAAAKSAEDLIEVPAPSDGVFYRRPSPDVPPYVEEGAVVSAGSVLGLVEVMKSFNQITYGGPGLPERGTVARIVAEDSAEVAYGQTLFLVRPA